MKLDLHGYTSLEAQSEVINALYSFENNDCDYEMTIIAGKGTGSLKETVERILEEHNIHYEENNSVYTLKK
jgi:DNA-nicking Smr family endonuclease